MTHDTDDTRSADGERREADAVPDSDVSRRSSTSRRRFLRASATATALAVGAVPTVSGQTLVEENCDSGSTFAVGDGDFEVINNQWSNESATQCIQRYDDGSYGWTFEGGSGDINYPQSYVGTRPWGSDTGVDEFPIARGDVEELTMTWDFDIDATGEWNLAEEWWLLDGQPSDSPSLTHEIMLVLDWSDQHSHGGDRETAVRTDRFGNQIDYWAFYPSGGTNADFHIFKINGKASSGQVDLTEIIDFLDERHGLRQDLTLTGIELGTETFDGPTGEVHVDQFDVTINGSTYTSGSDGGSGGDGGTGDTTPPTAPSNLSVTGTTSSSADLSWNAASDSGGSGLAGYNVYLDGGFDHSVGAGTTNTTVDGLAADASYEVGVAAEDGAGNESEATTEQVQTDSDGDGGDDGGEDGNSGDLIAEMDPSTTSPGVGERVTFSVRDTTGNDHWIDSLEWAFGDGATATGWWTEHSYDAPGSYTVVLTAIDNEGSATTHEVTVTVT